MTTTIDGNSGIIFPNSTTQNSPKNSLGKKWYHDPVTKQQKYFIQGQQPEGFVLGRG